MTTTRAIAWESEQSCGDCGVGVFVAHGYDRLPLCIDCGHLHPMDASRLGDGEEFFWADRAVPGLVTLHVRAYHPEEA